MPPGSDILASARLLPWMPPLAVQPLPCRGCRVRVVRARRQPGAGPGTRAHAALWKRTLATLATPVPCSGSDTEELKAWMPHPCCWNDLDVASTPYGAGASGGGAGRGGRGG